MAPREGEMGAVAAEGGSPGGVSPSAFWNRLNSLPVVQSTIQTTMGIYSISREKPILGKGLGVIEYGVNLASTPVKKVASSIVDKYPVASTTAHKLDSMALNCLDKLENKIPLIHESPAQMVTSVKEGATTAIQSGMTTVKNGASNAIHNGVTTVKNGASTAIHTGVDKVKNGASTALHTGVRRAMKTYPGQKVVHGLDSLIAWSEVTIDENETKPEENDQDVPEAGTRARITVRLRNGVVVPLKLYLHMLKLVKHMLANMAGVRTHVSVTSTPHKPRTSSPRKATPQTRKQLTPHKRLPEKSLVSSLTSSAMTMLGMKKTSGEEVAESFRQSSTETPDDCLCRSAEKRKRDEEDSSDSSDSDSSDSDSDVESINLAAALEHYEQFEFDQDPDYRPDDAPHEDSLEYDSGDAESDLETESAGISRKGEPLQQLKSKKIEPCSETKPPASQELPE